MENIINDSWPITLTPISLPALSVKVYDANGVECKYLFELNRLTGEGRRYSTNDSGNMFTIRGQLATESVVLKTPITITHNYYRIRDFKVVPE